MKANEGELYRFLEGSDKKFVIPVYQRAYSWKKDQCELLFNDLMETYEKGFKIHFFGGIVFLVNSLGGATEYIIIDGQQRITTLTLLLIYLLKNYGELEDFPVGKIEDLICSDHYGQKLFNLSIPERNECMKCLFEDGFYSLKDTDSVSVVNLVERYNDICECMPLNPHLTTSLAV